MNSNFRPWLEVFRAPNLATAPLDAVAGAAFTAALLGYGTDYVWVPRAAILIGLAELFFYLFGLADNDATGAAADATDAPSRPIPSGRLTRRAVYVASLVCLVAGIALANVAIPMRRAAYVPLVVAILLYNRCKDRVGALLACLLMGACRGFAFLMGVAAVMPRCDPKIAEIALPVAIAFIGWTITIAFTTWLGRDEQNASAPVPRIKAYGGILGIALAATAAWHFLAPIVGAAFAIFAWYCAVRSTRCAHTPNERRAAVGGTIGAFFYLQAGFALATHSYALLLFVFACFAYRRYIRAKWRTILGS